MGREACCTREDLNKGAWTAEEDGILKAYVQAHGEGRWRSLPKRAGLKRCGKSCRLRWLNYLRPDIKRGNISEQEEDLIIRLHRLLGNKWSLIAGRLPGRTDNEIKNYWNTNLKKRLLNRSSSQQLKCNKHEEKLKAGAAASARPGHEEERVEADGGKVPAVETPHEIPSSATEKRETQVTHDSSFPLDPQMESIWDLLLRGDAHHGSAFRDDAVDENSLLHCDGELQLWDDMASTLMETERSTVTALSPVDHTSGGGNLIRDWTSLFEPVQEHGTLDVELYDSSIFRG